MLHLCVLLVWMFQEIKRKRNFRVILCIYRVYFGYFNEKIFFSVCLRNYCNLPQGYFKKIMHFLVKILLTCNHVGVKFWTFRWYALDKESRIVCWTQILEFLRTKTVNLLYSCDRSDIIDISNIVTVVTVMTNCQ